LHFAVGLSGTLAFGFVVAAFLDDDAFGAAVVFLGSIGGGATTDPAPHHSLTPPCAEHAPCNSFAVENVPSTH